MDKTLTLLDRVDALQEAVSSLAENGKPGAVAFLGVTVSGGSYPTTAKAWYYVNPVKVSGNKGEGQTVTLTAGTTKILAANLGSQVPPAGTYVVVVGKGKDAAFTYDG